MTGPQILMLRSHPPAELVLSLRVVQQLVDRHQLESGTLRAAHEEESQIDGSLGCPVVRPDGVEGKGLQRQGVALGRMAGDGALRQLGPWLRVNKPTSMPRGASPLPDTAIHPLCIAPAHRFAPWPPR